jgi:adenylate cyclase
LLFFLLAVAFLPLFTMLGLIRAAAVRLEGGMDAVELLANLTSAAESTFLVYVVLGLWLTLILARSQTRPLEQAAKALRRIRDGDLDVDLRSASADEIGRMEDGVHELAATLRDRERILRTFGRIVDPVVRDHLLSGRYDSGGETLEATIMFCDLRGFTAMSENREPAEVVATINQFFTLMTDEVRRHGGFVDKFIGDALLVVFGLFSKEPIEEGDEGGTATAGADAAVRAGLAMRKLVGESGRASRGAQAPRLEISVAIHTGRVVAGMIGSADRHEYTVIGDTVNVAARLERVCKERGGGIVASTTTWQRARRAGVTATVVVEDTAELAGRREPVGYVVLESA